MGRRASGRRASGRRASRRRARPGLLAVVVVLCVLVAAVALTGTLIVAFSQVNSVRFAAPLRIYPVTRETPGPCLSGSQGVIGQGASGRTCYQVGKGIVIREVLDVHVQRAKNARHAVSIALLPADADTLARLTRRVVGRKVAMVVRDHVVAAPRVDMPITEGKILITGGLTKEEAADIVRELKSGRRPDDTPTPTGRPRPTGSATGLPSPTPTLVGPSRPSVGPVPRSPVDGGSLGGLPTVSNTARVNPTPVWGYGTNPSDSP